jgi:hypothetical protein
MQDIDAGWYADMNAEAAAVTLESLRRFGAGAADVQGQP